MHNTKWIHTLLLLVLVFFASCNNAADEAEGKKACAVVFRLSVDDATRSRATWEEGYDKSDADVPFDTRIDLDGLQVLVYGMDNSLIGAADHVLYWEVTSTGNANDNTMEEYEFVGDVSDLHLEEGTDYKVMVLVNCDAVGRRTDLGTHPYDISSLATAIPMWGVKSLTLSSEDRQDLGTIDLLRAAAKVEVALGSEMSEYAVKEITISHYNSRGYCAPADWNKCSETKDLQQGEAQPNTEEMATFNPHVSPATALTVTGDGTNKSLKTYLPEYNNKHTSDHIATISVTLVHTKGTADTSDDTVLPTFTDAIKFYKYNSAGSIIEGDGAEEYNIVRNHHYKFTIIGVAGELEIEYAVMDWTEAQTIELNEYAYPTYHNPIEAEPLKQGMTTTIKRNPVMWYSTDGSGDFWGYFYFEKGDNWTPTFLHTQSNYKIEVYNKEGGKVYDNTSSVSPSTKTPGWYLIKVKPKESAKSGAIVNLGITYTIGAGILQTPLYLYINGNSVDDIRWPDNGEGSDPKFIRIETISDQSIPSFVMDNDENDSNAFDVTDPTMKTSKGSDGKYTDEYAFTAYCKWQSSLDHLYWVPIVSEPENYAVRVYKKKSGSYTLIYSSYQEDGKHKNTDLNELTAETTDYYQIKVFPISDYSSEKPITLKVNYDRGNNQPTQLKDIDENGIWVKDSDDQFVIKHVSN